MIEQPNANVALTFEQLQQIDTVQNRLKNIENEITIATKNLNVVNKDVVKATKEREYQESLIANLTETSTAKQKAHDDISAQIVSANTTLAKTQQDTTEMNKQNEAKKAELDNREAQVSAREQEHLKTLSAFKIEQEKQNNDRIALNSAKEAFSEAVKKVVW